MTVEGEIRICPSCRSRCCVVRRGVDTFANGVAYLERSPFLRSSENRHSLPENAGGLLPPVFGVEFERLEVEPAVRQNNQGVSLFLAKGV